MDQNRFTVLTHSLTRLPSRRDVLRGLVGAGFGLGFVRLPEVGAAKKKRKKPKKAKPNAFGCLKVGDPCKNSDQCCSSICAGKKGERKCRAHDTGTCSVRAHLNDCGGTNVACMSSAGKQGNCATTTGNAAFCSVYYGCYACQTDAHCHTAFGGVLGPLVACIRCAECADTGGAACATADAFAG